MVWFSEMLLLGRSMLTCLDRWVDCPLATYLDKHGIPAEDSIAWLSLKPRSTVPHHVRRHSHYPKSPNEPLHSPHLWPRAGQYSHVEMISIWAVLSKSKPCRSRTWSTTILHRSTSTLNSCVLAFPENSYHDLSLFRLSITFVYICLVELMPLSSTSKSLHVTFLLVATVDTFPFPLL